MSRENVEVVRRAYERFARDTTTVMDDADLVELVDPEVHLDLTRRTFNPASYHGYEGMRRARREVRQAWERWTLQPERFIDAGDQVLVIETVRGRGRESGVELVDASASTYTVRDGRITRVVVYIDVGEAFQAAGLPEPERTQS